MEGIFFIYVLDAIKSLLEIIQGVVFFKKPLFLEEFCQIGITILHDKVKGFLILLSFIHPGDIGTFVEFELKLNIQAIITYP
jgi:hypothetical protein